MRKIDTTKIKEKTVGFVKDNRDFVVAFVAAFTGGLICYKLGEINERSKPDMEKFVLKTVCRDCFKSVPEGTDGFKIHSFGNETVGKFNGLDAAKSVLEDPETRDSIIGLAMFVKEK